MKEGRGPTIPNLETNKSQQTKQYRGRTWYPVKRPGSIMRFKRATPPFLWPSQGWITTNLNTKQRPAPFILAYPCATLIGYKRRIVTTTFLVLITGQKKISWKGSAFLNCFRYYVVKQWKVSKHELKWGMSTKVWLFEFLLILISIMVCRNKREKGQDKPKDDKVEEQTVWKGGLMDRRNIYLRHSMCGVVGVIIQPLFRRLEAPYPNEQRRGGEEWRWGGQVEKQVHHGKKDTCGESDKVRVWRNREITQKTHERTVRKQSVNSRES